MLQDLQHLDGCIFEANRRLQVAEEFAAGAEGEAQGAEGMLGRLRDQVNREISCLAPHVASILICIWHALLQELTP